MLDLETCGLSGAALFLVGLVRAVEGVPTVELLLARSSMPRNTRCSKRSGRSSPSRKCWSRTTARRSTGRWCSIAVPGTGSRRPGRRGGLLHVDMLHHARRRWRRQLPDCRLQTLEQLVCRRSRTGDIPGHRIPAAYADFVRTGFERDMEAILYHNAMDLVTLLDLTLRLAG